MMRTVEKMLVGVQFLCSVLSISYRAEGSSAVASVFNWIRDHDGFIHEAIELDPSSGHFVAKNKIPEDTLLLEIPSTCFVSVDIPDTRTTSYQDDRKSQNYDYCRLVDKMHDVLASTALSKPLDKDGIVHNAALGAYLREQLHRTVSNKPTYLWSKSAQQLLKKMLSEEMYPFTQNLPPWDVEIADMAVDCESFWDVSSRQDALQLISRQQWIPNNSIWVPLVDRIQHGSGNGVNVKFMEATEEAIRFYSTRVVSEGEGLTISYYPQGDSDEQEATGFLDYDTSDLFRDYGLVEPYPQHWSLDVFEFSISETANGTRTVSWPPDTEPFEIDNRANLRLRLSFLQLKQELKRLQEFSPELQHRPSSISIEEWEQIQEYRDSLMASLDILLKTLRGDPCEKDGNRCTVDYHFDTLERQEDNLRYDKYTCEAGQKSIMEEKVFQDADDTPDSMYQDIQFYFDPRNEDTCFQLDNTLQICSSYRPHYHDPIVHYTSRYLKEMKRVLFVGGGDSMLLNEILRYPELELVVGLELDQQVVRHSFKHFGTQPHWDNDKVEWWFGDAAKSLLMLPEEYFGSFDLVLVDLSETVLSFTVSEGLDIFGAMALLLNEKGIIVKNEVYFDKFAEIFDYSLQIHFGDVPEICCQPVVLGSYGNDFLTQEWYDHGVKPTLQLLDGDGRYDVWHDFSRNETNSKAHCEHNEPKKDENSVQETSPGILMILEAEDATGILAPAESLASLLSKTLQDQGLAVRSTVYDESSSQLQNPTVNIVMEEGYVTARTWPEKKYCAFDIHLWSRFSKHDDIKKALLTAVGSGLGKYSSSYRIVAGGMFGTTTWKEDKRSRGPRYTKECDIDDSETVGRTLNAEPSAVATMTFEALALANETDLQALVICGPASQVCESIGTLQQSNRVSNVDVIYTCDSIAGHVENSREGVDQMKRCLEDIKQQFERSHNPDHKIQVVVMDQNVPFAMGQVLHKFLSKEQHRKKYLEQEALALATVQDESQEWRRNFIDRFRTDILVHDPLCRANVLFNSTSTTMELDLVLRGDSLFYEHLVDTAKNIEKKTGLVSQISYAKGGMFRYQPDFSPTQWATPESYDQTGPLEQWLSQQPLGQQTLFQLELDGDVTSDHLISLGQLKSSLENALVAVFGLGRVESFSGIGKGALLIASWEGGSVNVLWDGRKHVDLNLFTHVEDMQVAKHFEFIFKRGNPQLHTILRDDQPRGYGRVVNYQKHIGKNHPKDGDRKIPHWAEHIAASSSQA